MQRTEVNVCIGNVPPISFLFIAQPFQELVNWGCTEMFSLNDPSLNTQKARCLCCGPSSESSYLLPPQRLQHRPRTGTLHAFIPLQMQFSLLKCHLKECPSQLSLNETSQLIRCPWCPHTLISTYQAPSTTPSRGVMAIVQWINYILIIYLDILQKMP